jgi:hypothetical protein
MNTRTMILAAVTVLTVIAAGCGAAQTKSPPVFGDVVAQQPVKFLAPEADNLIVAVNAQAQPLSRLLGDATLLVFLDESCGSAHAKVLRENAWINHDISVITVSPVTPGACSAEQSCTLDAGDSAENMISLCDAENILHSTYGIGPAGGVVLLDERGAVVNRGTLAQFDALRLQSADVARVARIDEDELIRMRWNGGEAEGVLH